MSEQRLTTLTPFGKSDKKSNKSPQKTFRLSFTLLDPNEDSCSVFDYGSSVKLEERKTIKKHKAEKETKVNGALTALNNENGDSDEDVKRLAQKFEQKYGEKKGKIKSYAELGAGYDETDPFIDNTEAYDETLQEDQETACGGYYINSGPLELKRVEIAELSDAEEIAKRRHKRGLSVIEEDEDDEEEDKIKNKEGDSGGEEAKPASVEGPPDTKKAKLLSERLEPEEKLIPDGTDLEEVIKTKKKRPILDDATPGGGALSKPKKAKTVKALLEEKRVHESPLEEPKKQTATITSINEAIESVVNAGNHDDNSNCSNSSQSGTASTSVSEDSQDGKPASQIAPPPLPENLSPEVLSLVDQIKRTATVTDNTRKTFCADINNALIKLEWKIRDLSTTSRNLLFIHLACYLPCTKDTLMRRAKKLFIHKEEGQIDTIICKLKATIDAAMPSLLEKYGRESQRIAEENAMSGTLNSENNLGQENQQINDSPTSKLPKRKFPWTEETRGYLKEIVRLKNRCFKVLKPRKNTNEEFITVFIHSKVRTLWPAGWMRTSLLLKEMNRSPHSGKSKHSSSHSPNKSDSSRLNLSTNHASPSPSNGPPHSLYMPPCTDSPPQPMKSPISTPIAAKTGTDPLNLLTKITSSIHTSPKKSYSPGQHQNMKGDKPESFSMDSLLKRTNESAMCNDYNTTLSDLMKKDSVIINGATLPLKNVNSNQMNDSSRSENILDLSSFSSSVTSSVIQSVPTNDRTVMRGSDSVSLSGNLDISKHQNNLPTPYKKEDTAVDVKKTGLTKDVERRMSEETTTATDILSQIINESLLAPSPVQPPASSYTNKVMDECKSKTPLNRDEDPLFDVMQDLKELNHLSSGGSLDTKQEIKKNNYLGNSWSHSSKPEALCDNSSVQQSQFHNEFLKHLLNTQDGPLANVSAPPYSRHSVSPYDSSPYMNEINKAVYSSSPLRTTQSISSHAGSSVGKVSQMNQGCIMKPVPNTGISTGSESQSHQ